VEILTCTPGLLVIQPLILLYKSPLEQPLRRLECAVYIYQAVAMEKLSLIRQLQRRLDVVPVIGPECVLSQ
jgi:hypothetical protein